MKSHEQGQKHPRIIELVKVVVSAWAVMAGLLLLMSSLITPQIDVTERAVVGALGVCLAVGAFVLFARTDISISRGESTHSSELAEVDDSASTVDDAAELRRIAAEATQGEWHWAGNIDTGEPYLATWVPGAGRCQVLSIGSEERSATSRQADQIRRDAVEYDLGDPDELVEMWAHDQFGELAKDPRLWFMTDLMADPARDKVIFEVAPGATSRDDPKVYRADISGIRHPDAIFMTTFSPERVTGLLDRLAQAERTITELRAQIQDGSQDR